ncbi:NAD(P)H-dependent oxidoreductase [uncultured Formosa sp.]|uniref:NAD(P)H-dependent oxidoreductase n=1 Tax=uncultured Formosa sp. TaxID=255435 RepID=UPI00261CFE96|nr:NAD(P)H-dependent oxidoreductase [uncultured Formosa sp.]
MDIIKQLQWRYATKKFDNSKIIDDQKINILLESFNLTATSYGLQPVKLVVVKNKILQAQLVTASMNQEQIGQASHVLVICIETVIDKTFINNYFSRVKALRNTPDTVLNPFKTFLINDFEIKEQLEIEAWAKKQAYLTLGNLLTVCAIEEIDSCPMEGFIPSEYDKLLQLENKNLKSVLVLPIGYRAKDDMFSELKKVRKPISDSIIHM